jgi:23S rRNA pseudouridine2457 synthase
MIESYLFYKPFNVLSQFTIEVEGQECLADYLKDIGKDVYPVGRLDYDSEGLLLLTNDKTQNKKLLQDSIHNKTYYVQVEGDITKEAILQLTKGVEIKLPTKKLYQTLPCKAYIIAEPKVPERNPPIRFRANIPTSWLCITLNEGKNRQIRKMCAKVGYPVLRLVRFSFSKFDLRGLNVGELKKINLY